MATLVRELADWVRASLPHIGRSYGQALTRLEHGVLLGLACLRRGALLFAGAAVAVAAWRWLGRDWLIAGQPAIATAGGPSFGFGLGRIGQRLRNLE